MMMLVSPRSDVSSYKIIVHQVKGIAGHDQGGTGALPLIFKEIYLINLMRFIYTPRNPLYTLCFLHTALQTEFYIQFVALSQLSISGSRLIIIISSQQQNYEPKPIFTCKDLPGGQTISDNENNDYNTDASLSVWVNFSAVQHFKCEKSAVPPHAKIVSIAIVRKGFRSIHELSFPREITSGEDMVGLWRITRGSKKRPH